MGLLGGQGKPLQIFRKHIHEQCTPHITVFADSYHALQSSQLLLGTDIHSTTSVLAKNTG